MDVDKELLRRVATVARLDLTDEELECFLPELKEILSAFSKIDSVDTEGIEPSMQPVPLRNTLRDDLVRPSLTQEQALSNATHKKDGYFLGPRAV